MFDLEAEFVVELWDLLKNHVAAREKDDACLQMLQIFDAHGFGLEDLTDLKGEDKDIDGALLSLYGEDEDEPDDDEESTGDY